MWVPSHTLPINKQINSFNIHVSMTRTYNKKCVINSMTDKCLQEFSEASLQNTEPKWNTTMCLYMFFTTFFQNRNTSIPLFGNTHTKKEWVTLRFQQYNHRYYALQTDVVPSCVRLHQAAFITPLPTLNIIFLLTFVPQVTCFIAASCHLGLYKQFFLFFNNNNNNSFTFVTLHIDSQCITQLYIYWRGTWFTLLSTEWPLRQ